MAKVTSEMKTFDITAPGLFFGEHDKHGNKIRSGDFLRGNDGKIYTVAWNQRECGFVGKTEGEPNVIYSVHHLALSSKVIRG